ncbi:uncharacterized protein [Physcomitrium patens]|uniref:uncharacterized protein isoform X2 n=1 Tax=Physcomitrium patens TaxID=3218 RepID=UPI003CCD87F1
MRKRVVSVQTSDRLTGLVLGTSFLSHGFRTYFTGFPGPEGLSLTLTRGYRKSIIGFVLMSVSRLMMYASFVTVNVQNFWFRSEAVRSSLGAEINIFRRLGSEYLL